MTAGRALGRIGATMLVLIATLGAGSYATGTARAHSTGVSGALRALVEQDSLRPGPDSARVAKLLDAMAATDRLACELVADQMGNFWWDGDDDGLGAFSDARAPLRVAKDSLRGHVRESRAITLLVTRLSADDPCVRRIAAKLLGRSAIPNDRLTALLDNSAPRVREAAAYAIGEGDRHGARSALESRLGGRDSSLAAMSAWALSELHDSASVPALIRAARSQVALVRLGVMRALGEIKDEGTVMEVERAVRDSHAGVRRAAVRALGELGLVRSSDVLAAALADKDAEVRFAAASALGELHELRRAPGALIRAASSTETRLAELAMHALAEIKDPATLDVLVGALAHQNREVRLSAVQALGEIRSAKAVPALLRALKDPDPEVRRAAAEALGEMREG